MSTAPAALDLHREAFHRAQAGRDVNEPFWLTHLRVDAFTRFQTRGLPTTRDEDWKYTSTAPITRTAFVAAEKREGEAVTEQELAPLTCARAFVGQQIVFVNGRYAPKLSMVSSMEGVQIRSLRELLAETPELLEPHLGKHLSPRASAFADLNAAFLEDGAFVSVAAGAVVRAPIHIVHFSARGQSPEPTLSHPRVLILAGRSSQAVVVESFGGAPDDTYLTNAVTEIVLADGAVLEHHKVQRESLSAYHVSTVSVRQGRDSRFSSHHFSLGGALSRTDILQEFTEPGGECVLNGLFMGSGSQHTDTHTFVDHAVPHCTTRELYKGILDGKSRGVFVGTVQVRKDAQKTDAQQTNKNLLLSREALVDSVPRLEIHADDVKCKHGSTTGQLDAGALFYLRARGIGEAEARALLTYAFASDVVSRVRIEPLRASLVEHLRETLQAAEDIKEAVA